MLPSLMPILTRTNKNFTVCFYDIINYSINYCIVLSDYLQYSVQGNADRAGSLFRQARPSSLYTSRCAALPLSIRATEAL